MKLEVISRKSPRASVNLLASLLTLAFAGSGCVGSSRPHAVPAQLGLARTFTLPGVRGTRPDVGVPGRIDHMAYDPETQRLFVAALENGSVEVLDLEKGTRIRSLSGLERPQGVAIAGKTRCAAVACGGDGQVHVFDTRSLEKRTSTLVGPDADNVRYDTAAHRFFVSYGDTNAGAIAVLDPRTWGRLLELRFESRPESFQLDPEGNRVFANLPGGLRAIKDGVVSVADRSSGRIEARIALTGAARNFPMAFDAAQDRVYIASRRPAKLIAIDTRHGRVVGEASCVDDSDDLFFDAQTSRVFVIGGGFRADLQEPGSRSPCSPPGNMGAIDVFLVSPSGAFTRLGSVQTAPHARTGLWVASRRALYLAVPMQGDRDPEIREYTVD
jgi:hypothetical protein